MFGYNPNAMDKRAGGAGQGGKANHARKYASKGEIVMRCRGRESGGVGLCVMGES